LIDDRPIRFVQTGKPRVEIRSVIDDNDVSVCKDALHRIGGVDQMHIIAPTKIVSANRLAITDVDAVVIHVKCGR
jgi:hypothetical protein